jgi:endonuclease/exonuclease/phosphatase (EEP) superfamily protein YafD
MRLGRPLLGAFTLVLLLVCLLLTVDRVLAPGGTVAVVAMTFVGYAVVGYLLCLAGGLWLRHRTVRSRGRGAKRLWSTVSVVALLGAALQAGWLAPSYLGNHPSQEPTLTVLQLNTRFGRADPRQVVRLAESRAADVVVLEELNARAAARLDSAGLGKLLPHRAGDADAGTMVFSRWPLRHPSALPVSKGAVRVRVASPRPFWVIGLHTTQPLVSTTTWQRDLARVRSAVARQHGAGVVVGDFNATLDHGPMRRLLGTGLHDAAETANAGWQPTWPSDGVARVLGVPVPVSLFTLDHVLVTDRIGVVATRTISVDGTDHKALVASLVR